MVEILTGIYCAEYDNSSVGEEERFEPRHLKEALLDWQVWLLSLINMTVTTAGTHFYFRLFFAYQSLHSIWHRAVPSVSVIILSMTH